MLFKYFYNKYLNVLQLLKSLKIKGQTEIKFDTHFLNYNY